MATKMTEKLYTEFDICVPLCDRKNGSKCKECDNLCVDEEDSLCHSCYHKYEGINCYCYDGDGTERPECDCGMPVRVRTILPCNYFEQCWVCIEDECKLPYYCDGGCGKKMGYENECNRICDFCEALELYEDDNPIDPIQCPISGP